MIELAIRGGTAVTDGLETKFRLGDDGVELSQD